MASHPRASRGRGALEHFVVDFVERGLLQPRVPAVHPPQLTVRRLAARDACAHLLEVDGVRAARGAGGRSESSRRSSSFSSPNPATSPSVMRSLENARAGWR